MRLHPALFGMAILAATVAPAHAWLIIGPDDTDAESIAADADGNVVVAGQGPESFPVMKVDVAERAALWVREFPAVPIFAPSSFPAPKLALLPDRDAVVLLSDATALQVHRLDADTGATVWDTAIADVPGESGRPGAVAIDATADVVVGARAFVQSLDDTVGLVVKLDGDDGSEIWRYALPEASVAQGGLHAVATLASGDVLAAAFAPTGDLQVVRLAGSDGSELWRYTTPAPLSPTSHDGAALVAGAGGDVFVAMANDQLSVLGLDGATGAEVWRYDTPQTNLSFATIAIGPDGDLIARGGVRVVKVAANDGSELWNTSAADWSVIDAQGDVVTGGAVVAKLTGTSGAALAIEQVVPAFGPAFQFDFQTPFATPVVLLAHEVVAIGQVSRNSQNRAFAVFGFADRLRGTKLFVKDPGDPSVRKLRLVSKDHGLALPEPDDPRAPTLAGATLEITNPNTNESTAIALPAAGWTVRPPVAIGGTLYKYIDKALVNGPCKVVVLKGNRALKAKCDGAQLAFTLDEQTQGALDIRFVLNGGFARCLSFGGTIVRDEPGQFIAKNAGAPATCLGGL
jgi:outer membrane protein assembly factor BamB